MSKTPQAKAAYSVRRELRLSRQKTAAAVLPWCLSYVRESNLDFVNIQPKAIKLAVSVADAMLAELARTEEKNDA